MFLLGIDTSTTVTSVCIQTGEGQRQEVCYPSSRDSVCTREDSRERHQEEITKLVEHALCASGLRSEDLFGTAGVLVGGAGPGSFTGLRIGLSFLKGLSYAWSMPLVLISTLEAASRELTAKSHTVMVCVEAGRGEVSIQSFRGALATGCQECEGERLLAKQDIGTYVRNISRRDGVMPGVLHDGCLKDVADVSELGASVRLMQREHLAAQLLDVAMDARVLGRPGYADTSALVAALANLNPHYGRPFRAVTVADRKAAALEREQKLKYKG